jgi:hypothetical protein
MKVVGSHSILVNAPYGGRAYNNWNVSTSYSKKVWGAQEKQECAARSSGSSGKFKATCSGILITRAAHSLRPTEIQGRQVQFECC